MKYLGKIVLLILLLLQLTLPSAYGGSNCSAFYEVPGNHFSSYDAYLCEQGLHKKNLAEKKVKEKPLSSIDNGEKYYKKGDRYYKIGDYKNAIKWYQKAVNLDHYGAKYWLDHARVLYAKHGDLVSCTGESASSLALAKANNYYFNLVYFTCS